uniref:Uncharacterized protein n=1 Tax=Amphimedon queenslandica TaxID=400682 RepID=A0A1X7UER4_AMPQE
MASIMGNFTNICYSLSLRHQLYQCYLNLATEDLPEEKLEVGQSINVIVPQRQFYYETEWILSTETHAKVSWAKEEGVTYQIGACVIVDKKDDIVFGKINNIFVVQHQVLLDVQLLTVEFHQHINSYIASDSTTFSVFVWAQELLDHHCCCSTLAVTVKA